MHFFVPEWIESHDYRTGDIRYGLPIYYGENMEMNESNVGCIEFCDTTLDSIQMKND